MSEPLPAPQRHDASAVPAHRWAPDAAAPEALPFDPAGLRAFEAELAERPFPETSARPLGTGRLVKVFALPSLPGIALKRLPPFPSAEQRARYQRNVEAYRQLLHTQLDIEVAAQRCVPLTSARGEPILYIAQAEAPADRLVAHLLAEVDDEVAARLLGVCVQLVARVWHRNAIDAPQTQTGLDARLSNWVLADDHALRLLYLDTTTPFFQRIGRDVIDVGLFLERVPTPARRFVREGLYAGHARFFDLRLVLLDLIADLYRHGQEARIPLALDLVNRYLATEEGEELHVEPLARREVDRMHRGDARFERRYAWLSRLGRFAATRLTRGAYPYVWP